MVAILFLVCSGVTPHLELCLLFLADLEPLDSAQACRLPGAGEHDAEHLIAEPHLPASMVDRCCHAATEISVGWCSDDSG
jgi:hypothetical protein